MTPAAADRARPMPAAPLERLDAAELAVAALREEQRRLERLGFEDALVRCDRDRRYWEFLRAIFRVAEPEAVRRPRRRA